MDKTIARIEAEVRAMYPARHFCSLCEQGERKLMEFAAMGIAGRAGPLLRIGLCEECVDFLKEKFDEHN